MDPGWSLRGENPGDLMGELSLRTERRMSLLMLMLVVIDCAAELRLELLSQQKLGDAEKHRHGGKQ